MMMRFLAILALVLGLTAPAHAQLTAEPPAANDAPATTELHELIRILEDDAARNRLIETLRAAAAEEAEEARPAPRTLAGQLAEYSAGLSGGVIEMLDSAIVFTESLAAIVIADIDRIGTVILNVALVILAAFTVLALARLAAGSTQRRLDGAAAGNVGYLRRAGLLMGSIAIDAATVLLAWGAATVLALWLVPAGRIGFNQALFLNAFLVIEFVKVAIRAALAPHHAALRLLPIGDTSGAYWYFWLSRLVSVIGYTFLFAAPILAANVSLASAYALRIIVLLATLVMACLIVLQNRDDVRRRLIAWARRNNSDLLGRVLVALASIWHIIAIIYLTAIFVLWLVNPDEALPFALSATLRTVIAVALGAALISLITRYAAAGMNLPDDIRQRLPLLEQRLNAFVPNMLQVVRLVVLAAILFAIAQAWQIADVAGWLAAEAGQRTIAMVVSIVLILAIGGMIYLAVSSWVEYRLNPNYGTVPTARERTLLSLFRNAITTVLAVLVFMLVLSEIGVNIGPLLAGAGVVGLAIGFGAQKLVQDVISGGFIQFENSMNEGDVVTAGGITGVVEKLTIRSVALRSLDGVYHVVPFSSVDAVSNFMKYFSYHVAAIGVAYREHIPEVKEAMDDAFAELRKGETIDADGLTVEYADFILSDIEMDGVTELADSSVIVRARIKTVPGKQWMIGRAYNEIVKRIFDERGIEIPFPHMTVYMGQGKDGSAPPLHIEQVGSSGPMPQPPAAGAPGKSDATTPRTPAKRRRRRAKRAADADKLPDLPGSEEL